jgi:hypothetical protein
MSRTARTSMLPILVPRETSGRHEVSSGSLADLSVQAPPAALARVDGRRRATRGKMRGPRSKLGNTGVQPVSVEAPALSRSYLGPILPRLMTILGRAPLSGVTLPQHHEA